jgi:hypothetical protein
VNNEHDTPEALAARIRIEIREVLLKALDVLSWRDIIALQHDLAREHDYDLVACLLEANLNILNDLYGFGDLS